MNRAARCIAAGIAACGCWLAVPCRASQPSLTECLEASDFVGNAALSRDNGISAQKFIARMQQDFVLVHAFPQELRWFVHDAEDESYLLEAARDVFARPASPEEHRRAFLESCFERMAALPPPDPPPPQSPAENSVR